MVQLTDLLIQHTFSQLGLEEKYFPRFKSEVKKCYTALQDGYPDDETVPDEDSNVKWSLLLTTDYIRDFVKELEKGHCEKWADAYARNISVESELITIHIAMDAMDNKDELERELEIHANSLSKDIVFKRRYKSLLLDWIENAKELAEEYTEIYHGCIDKGKSEYYAHAYAYAANNYSKSCWEIYALSYEEASKHGMNDFDAHGFGYTCIDSADRGFFLELNDSKKLYKEDWQRDFYIQLLQDDFEKYNKYKLTDSVIESIRESFNQ